LAFDSFLTIFFGSSFYFTLLFLPSLEPFVPSWPQSALAGFNGVENDKLPGVFHEDKGKSSLSKVSNLLLM
jgi:hypothetical protein